MAPSTQSRGSTLVGRAKTLSIMPTYTCPASCEHCGSLSSPRVRGALPLDSMLTAIAEARRLGFCNVVFTGGEATLRWSDLLAAIRYAARLEFPTRVVSNAYWATTPEQAARRIDELIGAGLTEINYSTGDEHARFIPVGRVVNAIVAAVTRSLRTSVVVELRGTRRVTKEMLEADPNLRALSEDQRKCLDILEGPWMPLDPFSVEDYASTMTTDRTNVSGKSGCNSLLQTYTLQADGRLAACCGIGQRLIPELTVGRETGPASLQRAIERAEGDFLKLWIHYVGPEKILAWAAEKDPTIEWEGMYAHHCQACARLYRDPKVARVIRAHHGEMLATVMQAAWLDERHVPRVLAKAEAPA